MMMMMMMDDDEKEKDSFKHINENDKRLFIQEPEFSGLLKVSTRDGSIISQILRKAWDSDRIENQTKYDFSVCKRPETQI